MIGGTAWLFPGQGTDLATIAPDSLQPPRAVHRMLTIASEVVGRDLIVALGEQDPVILKTEIAQPALVAATLGLACEREAAFGAPDVVTGHSLGELTAMAFAGCLTAEEAIRAAADRGRLMAEAARAAPGGMAAFRCANRDEFQELLAHGQRHGALNLAARNSPNQWVVSGDHAALQAVLARAPGSLLPVSGPWHSPAMTVAASAWEPRLRALNVQAPRLPIMVVGSATLATSATDWSGTLLRQLTQPVLWSDSIEALLMHGIAHFVPIGPGRVLKGLCRDIIEGYAQATHHPCTRARVS